MVYHRSDSGGSSSADAAPRKHSESSRGSARDEEERPKSRDGKEDYSRSSSRYKDGRYSDSSRSRNGKDDGKYSDSSRYSKDSRSRDGREEGKYHERSREGREEGSRYRDGKDDGRYSEGSFRHGDSTRYSESRYSEGSRYSSGGSRYGSGGGNGDSWYSESSRHRDDSRYYSGGSSRYQGDDGSGGDETEDSSASTAKTEQEKLKNVFQNDGSFLEMFKKMQEATKVNLEAAESSASEPSTSEVEATVKQEAVPGAAPAAVPRRPVAAGIVGKRRGGRVLPTGLVKKQKKEEEVEETPKDAWSLYMAEVRKYKEASCEEEGKTRPLVK